MIYDTKQICRKLLNLAKVKKESRKRERDGERLWWWCLLGNNGFLTISFALLSFQKICTKSDATWDGASKRRRNGIFASDTFGRHETSFNTYTKVCWHFNTHAHTHEHNKSILLCHCVSACVIGSLFFFEKKEPKTNVVLPFPQIFLRSDWWNSLYTGHCIARQVWNVWIKFAGRDSSLASKW